jgi:hypothetical protein
VSGRYSVKDVLAHLTAYEQALVKWLEAARDGRVYIDQVLDQPDVHRRNAVIHAESRHRSAAEVVADFEATFAGLEAVVEVLTDEQLFDAQSTAWFVAPRWQRAQPVWQCIANDSYEHHDQHLPDIEAWLQGK